MPKRKFLDSKLAVFILVIILGMSAIGLGKELKKRYTIEQEIRRLQSEVQQFETKNQELLSVLNYLNTQEYRERQARSLLNLQKPGEFVVALPLQPTENPDVAESFSKSIYSNPQLWWNYFFKYE